MHLIFDFDGTITVQDTIGELAASAVAWQQQRLGCNLQGAWDEAVRAYGSDLAAAAEKTHGSERRTVEDEIRFLAETRAVEEASLERVERTGIFAGLGLRDLFQMGASAVREGRVKIRAGFGALTELAARRGWRTSVLSAHWSRAFVEGALSAAPTTVYFGDSMTDFECLIKEAGGADYGVVMVRDDDSSVL
ncbi:hypothetical protein CP533_4117, partial [Ophiocordyceps camponoti-saundersi (nom. inval.)]